MQDQREKLMMVEGQTGHRKKTAGNCGHIICREKMKLF